MSTDPETPADRLARMEAIMGRLPTNEVPINPPPIMDPHVIVPKREEPESQAAPWCQPGGTIGRLHRPITEDWLRQHEFRIEAGRVDSRLPLRRLAVKRDCRGEDGKCSSPDDLCIDVAPNANRTGWWFVWIHQEEPYRTIHIRDMRETHEIAKLYEGLTGQLWPGTL